LEPVVALKDLLVYLNQSEDSRLRLGLVVDLAALTRHRDVDAEFCCIDGMAAKLVPQYARYADLCILGLES
jgi:hypothetical protein